MTQRKGIVLAGGLGTRLRPITNSISKQLLPIYNKPMIYYSLSTLMLSKMQDILLISSPDDIFSYQKLLGDGSSFGCNLSYAVQEKADGLASAFIIGKDFVGNNPSALILGDNLFYGSGLAATLAAADNRSEGATIFGKPVKDPRDMALQLSAKMLRSAALKKSQKIPHQTSQLPASTITIHRWSTLRLQ